MPGHGKVDRVARTILSIGSGLLCAALLCACDDPPRMAPSEVDVDEQRAKTDRQVEQTRQQARERIAETDEKIPDRDVGTSEDADDQ